MAHPGTGLRVTVIGIGYLGLTHAVCMAELGHDVIGMDVNGAKVTMAARGNAPFFEPGLEPLLRKNLDAGRLRLTTSYSEAAEFGQIHFLCVDTPPALDGSTELQHVASAVDRMAPHLTSACLVVGKSTVPVGTARALAARIKIVAPTGSRAELAWSPEFLREGHAVTDTLSPDRLVFGVTSDWATRLLKKVYARPIADGVPTLVTNLETAELVKQAANAFLATKISFINAIAEVCDATGADVLGLVQALGYDERIGQRCLRPGLGFGGGCLPKDVRAFATTASSLGVGPLANILHEVDTLNVSRRSLVTELARRSLGGTLADRRVAVLGVAFKPGTDDVRDSPSLDVCSRLLREGAIVSAHDPAALPNASLVMPQLHAAHSVVEAVQDAELILHLTEWPDYLALDPALLATVVTRRAIIDARCALDTVLWHNAGWQIQVPGRLGRSTPMGCSRQDHGSASGQAQVGVHSPDNLSLAPPVAGAVHQATGDEGKRGPRDQVRENERRLES